MAVDPGGITGIAAADIGSLASIKETLYVKHVPTIQEDFSACAIWNEIASYCPDVLVLEDFRLFPDVPHTPDPVGTLPDRLLARIDLLVYLGAQSSLGATVGEREGAEYAARRLHVEKQMPGERNAIATDWLKQEGLWRTPLQIPGSVKGKKGDHAMAALKHLLVYRNKKARGRR